MIKKLNCITNVETICPLSSLLLHKIKFCKPQLVSKETYIEPQLLIVIPSSSNAKGEKFVTWLELAIFDESKRYKNG